MNPPQNAASPAHGAGDTRAALVAREEATDLATDNERSNDMTTQTYTQYEARVPLNVRNSAADLMRASGPFLNEDAVRSAVLMAYVAGQQDALAEGTRDRAFAVGQVYGVEGESDQVRWFVLTPNRVIALFAGAGDHTLESFLHTYGERLRLVQTATVYASGETVASDDDGCPYACGHEYHLKDSGVTGAGGG